MRRTAALIAGGGPAGASVAIGLARDGARPLLLERQRETGDALCGGFLSWRTLQSLARLGVDADDLNRARVTRLRLVAGARVVEAPLPAPAVGVSRHRLDLLLLARAEAAGAAVERGVSVRAVDDGVVRTADGATIAADALFLASGKHDLRGLARPADARGADPTMGLRVRLPATASLRRELAGVIELHLVDGGYAGIVLQEDGTANCCLAVRQSRLGTEPPTALLARIGREAPRLGERLAHATGAAPDAIANVPYGWRERHGRPGLFRLGDQAGVIPSLAGEGMGIAVASAADAAAAYARGGPGAAAAWQPRFARRLARPIAIAGALRDLAERPAAAAWLPLARASWLIQIVARATRVPVETR